jgi:hypothetical protein
LADWQSRFQDLGRSPAFGHHLRREARGR